MKAASGIVVALALGLGGALLPGCGGMEADAQQEGPEFPSSQDPQAAPQTEAQYASTSIPAGQPVGADPDGVPGSTSEEEAEAAQAQLQPGEVEVGAADATDDYADTDPSALQDFRGTLDPYGSWVEDPTYGTIWEPSQSVVGDGFEPYVSNGYWSYDNDWTWVSGYDWGWAPFHYGRWVYAGNRWGWIPGRRYAGAWVSWRAPYDGYGYVGWAPMPPRWYWYRGAAVGLGFVPRAPFAFCRSGDVFYRGEGGLGGRLVTGAGVATVASHTRPYPPASPTVNGGGRIAAQPTVGGPPPSQIGVSPTAVNHVPAGDQGILHATQFAHPSTAGSLGAHAPSMMGARAAPTRTALGTMPRTSGATAFGAYGRADSPVVTAPRYNGVAPSRPVYGGYQRYSAPTYYGGARPGYGGGAYGGAARPYYGGAPAHYGAFGNYAPHAYSGVHPGTTTTNHAPEPSYEAPHPSGGRGGGGFRGGGGGGRGGGGHR